ncbi:hypothetical protein T492DRAFT_984249 [Pavlovales sp. CCMP2436]|nr:hypothetical protein T492DRAFT_984249 [Pavlovales sp. CCMP2436]
MPAVHPAAACAVAPPRAPSPREVECELRALLRPADDRGEARVLRVLARQVGEQLGLPVAQRGQQRALRFQQQGHGACGAQALRERRRAAAIVGLGAVLDAGGGCVRKRKRRAAQRRAAQLALRSPPRADRAEAAEAVSARPPLLQQLPERRRPRYGARARGRAPLPARLPRPAPLCCLPPAPLRTL